MNRGRGDLQVSSAAAERARSIAAQSEQAAQVRRRRLAADAGGIAALDCNERVQHVEAADAGVRVPHPVHDAAVRRQLPAGRCGQLDFAVHVAGEAHGSRQLKMLRQTRGLGVGMGWAGGGVEVDWQLLFLLKVVGKKGGGGGS